MSDDLSPAPARRPGNRRGPDRRQRPLIRAARVSPGEAAAMDAKAAAAGISVGDLIRHAVLDVPLPRRRARRPAADLLAVAALLERAGQLSAELGKQGSNLNQLAHQVNAGRLSPSLSSQIEAALAQSCENDRALLDLRTACMDALGFERSGSDDDEA